MTHPHDPPDPHATPAPGGPPATHGPISVDSDPNVNDPHDGHTLTPGPTNAPLPTEPAARAEAVAHQREEQAHAAEQRADGAAAANSGTPQAYNVTTPFSGTSLTFGSAVGGPGASLTTLGQVLVDAVGTMGLQSKGAFTAQTTSGMKLLSTSGTNVHTGAKIEVFAGGGIAPGPCGCGGPATPEDKGPPAKTAEAITNVVAAGPVVLEGIHDVRHGLNSATTGHGILGWQGMGQAVRGAVGTVQGVVSAFGNEGASGHAEILGGGFKTVFGGLMTGDISGTADGVSEIIAGVASRKAAEEEEAHESAHHGGGGHGGSGGGGGGGEGGGGGPTDIEERSSNEIKMVANNKISGMAPTLIEFKTANKFSTTAALVIDYTTTAWSAFGAAKFEVKSMGSIKANAFVMWGVTALGTGKITTPELKFDSSSSWTSMAPDITFTTPSMTITGDTKVEHDYEITGKTTVKANLLVEGTGDVTLKDNFTVVGKVEVKGHLNVNQDVDMDAEVTIDAACKNGSRCTVTGTCKFA